MTREEQCGNCGLKMSPGHQCEIWTDDSKKTDDKEETKEKLHCDKCYVFFLTKAHLMKHIDSNHILGPECANHFKQPEKCRDEPGKCRTFQPKGGMERYRTTSKA